MYRSSSSYGDVTKDSSVLSSEEHDEDGAKEEQFLDDEGSSEFIDNPISSPVVRSKIINNTTPLKTPSVRSPSSSVKRKSLYELREKRNSRLFNSQAENTRLFNDTLNIENNMDILDFDQSILPRLDYSPRSWKYQSTSNNSHEIEGLKKKVTGYQLQIRLIMDFLQKNGTNDLLSKLESEDFELTRCNKCEEKEGENKLLDKELASARDKYESVEKKLQMYQEQLTITNDQLAALLNVIDDSESLVDDILLVLEGQFHDETNEEIIQVKGMEIDLKLAVVLKALSRISEIDKSDSLKIASKGSFKYMGQELVQLQQKFQNSQEQLLQIQNQLNTSAEESGELIKSYRLLKDLLSSHNNTINELKALCSQKDETIKEMTTMIERFKLENNNSEINGLSKDVEKMLLTSDANMLAEKDLLRQVESLEEEKFTLSNEVSSAQSRIEELNVKLEMSKSEFDNRIRSLQSESQDFQDKLLQKERELGSLKRELDNQKLNGARDKQNQINSLKHELSVAAEKERELTTEKFLLKHHVESISKEKKTLQLNVEILKEKLANHSKSNSDNQDGFWNLRYEDLLASDTKIATRFLKIFEEILDTQSIEQAKLKILELSNRSSLPRDQKRVKELHESIFHYYVSGIKAIIQDYLSLIRQLELVEKDKNFKILNLTHELNHLKKQTTSEMKNDENKDEFKDENKDDHVLRLRIEDLTKKWKLERESRKVEGDNLKKRLADLERENLQLKKKLQSIS